MKKFFTTVSAFMCLLLICSCSDNPTKDKPTPPAPKPNNFIDVAAVAARKADYYVRLSLDFADGYLSNQSVAASRYGTDTRYVESLEFLSAPHDGKIYSNALGKFYYWYRNIPDSGQPATLAVITDYPEMNNYPNKYLKRQYAVSNANRGKAAKEYWIHYRNTDITNEELEFTIVYSSAGFATAQTTTLNKTFDLCVLDSSGVYSNNNKFSVVANITGKVRNAGPGHTPSATDVFTIESGSSIILTGVDISTAPAITYTITLNYTDNKVEGKTGNFTGTNGFTANYTATNGGAYYTIGSDTQNKKYVFWDYPL